jgi:prepilin-type N-terminal cleavage/methylation domain-containing protein
MTVSGRLRARLSSESGYSLIELLIALAILGTVTGAVTVLFLQASSAQVDMNRRYRAQQDARVAVDKMRREIHCANGITPAGTSNAITVTLPSQCPTAGGSVTTVTYDVVGTGQRFQLRRNTVVLADFVSEQNAFDYTAPVANTSRGKLRVTLPINIEPSNTNKEWRLVADIVLRNTSRA